MDLGLGIGIAGGSISLAGIILGFIQWSLKRNVDHEDKAKEHLEERVERLAGEVHEHKKQADTTSRELELKYVTLEGGLKNATSTLGEIRGVLQEMRSALEAGREKQASFYREELLKLEQTFRQELSRHVYPDLPERVAKLEALAPKRKKV